MKRILLLTGLIILMITGCNPTTKVPADFKPAFAFQDPSLSLDERVNDLVGRLSLEEKVLQMVYAAPEVKHLDIPEYNWWSEALHGVARSGRATVFPQAIGLGATFDADLLYEIASSIGDEARAKYNIATSIGNRGQYAGLTFWSPNVNIFRDPRWGRGQETYGEDPYLSGQLGSSFVKGLQGDNTELLKAAACAKHFVVHSGPEKLRHEFNALASPRDMQETYLPAFRALSDANVEGFMCAYNRTNDEPCCGSHLLLTQILREEWGFDGYITSDCWAIRDFFEGHMYSVGPAEAAALALKSGVNLNCGNVFHPYLLEAVEKGLITEDEIDASLRQLLKTRFRLGLFDPESMNPFKDYGEEKINAPEHRALALKAAEKSMVLLKNNAVLPISKDIKSIYLVGPHAATNEVLLGNYYGVSGQMSTFLEGITSKVSAGTTVNYKHAFLFDRENINPIDWSTGDVKTHEITFVFAGISGLLEGEEGESIASEYAGDRYDYGLPDAQVNFIKKISSQKDDKPLVLVLTGGSPVDVAEIEPFVDAIIYAWYPGEEGGNAFANLVFGDVNFSGRLPITFPKSLDQLPPYEDYNMQGRTYKYMNEDPQYTFGYGLSYTNFNYTEIIPSSGNFEPNSGLTVKVKVENSGGLDGEEVVQLYCSFPENAEDAPNYRLIGFKRIQLRAGSSGEVTFNITSKDLNTFDEAGNPLLVAGKYQLHAGGASPMKRSKELGINFTETEITLTP